MKTWNIKIKAKDEDEALTYLEILTSSFKAALKLKEEMNDTNANDPRTGSKMTCKKL
jgi:hypothetical protein